MKAPKYNIDDWVLVTTPPEYKDSNVVVAHILEIGQQKCEAGIEQTMYKARVWARDGAGPFHITEVHIREMELGEKIEFAEL